MSWQFHGKNEFMINSHIQDIPENGADNAHLEAVHGPSILTGSDVRFSRTKFSIGSHVWSAKYKNLIKKSYLIIILYCNCFHLLFLQDGIQMKIF